MVDSHQQLVLIVDDDAGMRQAMGRLLSAAGYRTAVFCNAEEAQASRLAGHAQCLVLDVHLPGLSGIAWYASLGAARPPVVFVSALKTAALQLAVQHLDDCRCLTKPFDGGLLVDAVNAAIAKPQPG